LADVQNEGHKGIDVNQRVLTAMLMVILLPAFDSPLLIEINFRRSSGGSFTHKALGRAPADNALATLFALAAFSFITSSPTILPYTG